jgi:molybdopterin synthase catalytic subunit
MGLTEMIEQIKSHHNIKHAGMILCHNGIVRQTSRDGHPVQGIEISINKDRLNSLIGEMRRQPGIVEVLAEVREGRLMVGEDIMWVVVAGDIRDNVFPVLVDTVDRIKREVAKKVEF